MSDAYNQGRQARRDGVAVKDNPYRVASYKWYQWRNGWDAERINAIRLTFVQDTISHPRTQRATQDDEGERE